MYYASLSLDARHCAAARLDETKRTETSGQPAGTYKKTHAYKGPVSTDAKHPRSRGHTSPESIQRRAVPDGFLLADTRRWAACPRARQVGELTHASTGRTCHAHPWYMLMSCTRTCHAHTDAPLPAPSGRTGRARVRYGCLGSRAAQHHGRTRRRQSSRPHGRTAGGGRCAPLKFGRERITPSAVMPARVFWCECSHQAPRKFESVPVKINVRAPHF